MDATTKQELAVKSAATNGAKSAHSVTSAFMSSSFAPLKRGHDTEINMRKMLKARSPRLVGRSTVIGNTVFAFDKYGVCSVLDQGNTRLDFEVLLQQNGVFPYEVAPAVVKAAPPVAAAPPVVVAVDTPVDAPVDVDAEKPADKKKKSVFSK